MKKRKQEMVRIMIGTGENSMFVLVPKGKRLMIGSGDNAMFIKAGETHKSLDERTDELLKECERTVKKENIKKKVRSLFK